MLIILINVPLISCVCVLFVCFFSDEEFTQEELEAMEKEIGAGEGEGDLEELEEPAAAEGEGKKPEL